MSFPEWGQSYNALHVPLTSDWQCSLVPARDVTEPTSWWGLSYDEREQKRKDRNKQIEQDRRDFDRLFRVSIDRQNARTSDDFHTYVAFIREHLSISGMGTPIDGEDVTRILREAVRDGWLFRRFTVPGGEARASRGPTRRRVGRSERPTRNRPSMESVTASSCLLMRTGSSSTARHTYRLRP
jgi:hypothetical protein